MAWVLRLGTSPHCACVRTYAVKHTKLSPDVSSYKFTQIYFTHTFAKIIGLIQSTPDTLDMNELFKYRQLRARRALSVCKVYGYSALLVLKGTSLNSDCVLLVLNCRYHGKRPFIHHKIKAYEFDLWFDYRIPPPFWKQVWKMPANFLSKHHLSLCTCLPYELQYMGAQ